jgi:hypothetical protein
VTGQSSILRLSLNGNYTHPDNKSWLYCQQCFFCFGLENREKILFILLDPVRKKDLKRIHSLLEHWNSIFNVYFIPLPWIQAA